MQAWSLRCPKPRRAVSPGDTIPTFSVIIAAFNADATIREAVSSAVSQEPAPLEVIVCDDGSKADPAELLADFPLVRVVRIDHGGEAAAKTTAAQEARGDFVVILDADDVFLPGRLEALTHLAINRPDLDLLTTDAFFMHKHAVVRRCYESGHTFDIENQDVAILERNFIFGLAAVRRSTLHAAGYFDSAISHTTDWHCWIRLLTSGCAAGCVMEPLAEYRLNEGAMNADRIRMVSGRIDTLQHVGRTVELRADQRAALEATIARNMRELDRERARVSILSRSTIRRPSLATLARSSSQPMRVRAAACLGWIFPALACGWLMRKERRTFRTVGGLELPRTQPLSSTVVRTLLGTDGRIDRVQR